MEHKKSQKYLETHEKILENVLSLLKKKELHRISVAEVCRKAGINRSTFYKHYQDTYDVIDKTGKKYAEKLAVLITTDPQTTSWERTLNTLNFIKDHRDFYSCFLKAGRMIRIPDELLNRNAADQKVQISKSICGDDPDAAKFLRALVYGSFNAVVREWIAGDCRISPERLCEIFYKIKNISNLEATKITESAGERNA